MKINEREALTILSGFIPSTRQVDDGAIVEDQSYFIHIDIDNADGMLYLRAGPSDCIETSLESGDKENRFQTRLDPLEPFRRYHAMAVAKEMGIPATALRQVTGFIYQLIHYFNQQDCLILEVDPMTVPSGGDIQLGGCRLEIDDDAIFRQPDLPKPEPDSENHFEKLARSQNITYVELGGDIAIMSGGAGSTMAVVDLVHHFGGRPANFVDAMGGAGLETIRNLVNLVLTRAETDPAIKVVLLSMNLSATPMKQIIEAFCEGIKKKAPQQPMVGYLHAGGGALLNMSLNEAHDLLRSCGMLIYPNLDEAIQEAVRLSLNDNSRS